MKYKVNYFNIITILLIVTGVYFLKEPYESTTDLERQNYAMGIMYAFVGLGLFSLIRFMLLKKTPLIITTSLLTMLISSITAYHYGYVGIWGTSAISNMKLLTNVSLLSFVLLNIFN